MDTQAELLRLAEDNGGVLTTSAAVGAGISKPTLAAFVKANDFQCVQRGVYCSPDAWTDELYLLHLRCPKTVFSHETALYLHDMCDRTPEQLSVTARYGYNPSHLLQDGIRVYTVKKELFHVGRIEMKTFYGHTVVTYDAERTICDMVRSKSSVDMQSYQDALKEYGRRSNKNLSNLLAYARLFHIEKKVRLYLEVLL